MHEGRKGSVDTLERAEGSEDVELGKEEIQAGRDISLKNM